MGAGASARGDLDLTSVCAEDTIVDDGGDNVFTSAADAATGGLRHARYAMAQRPLLEELPIAFSCRICISAACALLLPLCKGLRV